MAGRVQSSIYLVRPRNTGLANVSILTWVKYIRAVPVATFAYQTLALFVFLLFHATLRFKTMIISTGTKAGLASISVASVVLSSFVRAASFDG